MVQCESTDRMDSYSQYYHPVHQPRLLPSSVILSLINISQQHPSSHSLSHLAGGDDQHDICKHEFIEVGPLPMTPAAEPALHHLSG